MSGETRWSERPPNAPLVTLRSLEEKQGLYQYDGLTAIEAVAKAWSEPGEFPTWHYRMQQIVRKTMPVLSRALDRLTEENKVGEK